jgi:hypothetical protein
MSSTIKSSEGLEISLLSATTQDKSLDGGIRWFIAKYDDSGNPDCMGGTG